MSFVLQLANALVSNTYISPTTISLYDTSCLSCSSNVEISASKCGISAKKEFLVLKAKFVVTDTALYIDSHFPTKRLASSVLNHPRECYNFSTS